MSFKVNKNKKKSRRIHWSRKQQYYNEDNYLSSFHVHFWLNIILES